MRCTVVAAVDRKELNSSKTRNQYASSPRGNAIPAGPLSDFDEILCRWINS